MTCGISAGPDSAPAPVIDVRIARTLVASAFRQIAATYNAYAIDAHPRLEDIWEADNKANDLLFLADRAGLLRELSDLHERVAYYGSAVHPKPLPADPKSYHDLPGLWDEVVGDFKRHREKGCAWPFVTGMLYELVPDLFGPMDPFNADRRSLGTAPVGLTQIEKTLLGRKALACEILAALADSSTGGSDAAMPSRAALPRGGEPPFIESLGHNRYRMETTERSVGERADCIFQAFLEVRRPLLVKELVALSGIKQADAELRRIKKGETTAGVFALAVKIPGGVRGAGYFVDVRKVGKG